MRESYFGNYIAYNGNFTIHYKLGNVEFIFFSQELFCLGIWISIRLSTQTLLSIKCTDIKRPTWRQMSTCGRKLETWNHWFCPCVAPWPSSPRVKNIISLSVLKTFTHELDPSAFRGRFLWPNYQFILEFKFLRELLCIWNTL